MAEKHVHKVYGSFPPWGKSVEFPANGGGGNYVYYSGTIRDFVELISLVSIIKENKGNEIFFKPAGQFWAEGNELNNVIGVGYDLSMKVSPFEPQEMFTVGDLIAEYSKNWTQITEEEFYDTNLGNVNPE